MSPRKRDPEARLELIDIAARLIAEEGADALSTRRVAKEAGTSTTGVYTYFGSMSGLVREIVHEGFARLARDFSLVKATDDPVTDMALIGRAYRHSARTNANLFAVMFGGKSLAGFELSEEDRKHGRYNLTGVVDGAQRCIEAGRFTADDPFVTAHHMWVAIHGLVTLELGDYLIDPCDADRCFETQLVTLMIGEGDSAQAATASVAASAKRFPEEILTP